MFSIVYFVDDDNCKKVYSSISSLISNKDRFTSYKIYILGDEENNFLRISRNVMEKKIVDSQIEFQFIDTRQHPNSNMMWRISFIQKNIKETSVLLLDEDTFVRKDLSELFDIDIDNKYAAVVNDQRLFCEIKDYNEIPHDYFDPGIILLNLQKMHSDNLMDNDDQTNDDKYNSVEKLYELFKDNIVSIPIKYDCMWDELVLHSTDFSMFQFNSRYNTNYSCLWDLLDDSVILHFVVNTENGRLQNIIDVGTKNRSVNRSSDHMDIEIPVVFATDNNYAIQTGVAITSILENRIYGEYFRFYILVSYEFDNEVMDALKAIENRYSRCSIELINMGDSLKNVEITIPSTTYQTYFRLFIPNMFLQYDKVIYLDSDIIVEEDLFELFSIEIDDYLIAGVKGSMFHMVPGNDHYINAGILVMNLKMMREKGIQNHFIELIPEKLPYQDQDIINKVCREHIFHIGFRYNCAPVYETRPDEPRSCFSNEEITNAYNLPAIIHFNGVRKPWVCLSVPLSDRWWHYSYLSSFSCISIKRYFLDIVSNCRDDRYSNYLLMKINKENILLMKKCDEMNNKITKLQSDCLNEDKYEKNLNRNDVLLQSDKLKNLENSTVLAVKNVISTLIRKIRK